MDVRTASFSRPVPMGSLYQQRTLAKAGVTFLSLGEPDQNGLCVLFPLAVNRDSGTPYIALHPDTETLPLLEFVAPRKWGFPDGIEPTCSKCLATGIPGHPSWTRLWAAADPKTSSVGNPNWLFRCEGHGSGFSRAVSAKPSDAEGCESSKRRLTTLAGQNHVLSLGTDSFITIKVLLPRPCPREVSAGDSVTFFRMEMNGTTQYTPVKVMLPYLASSIAEASGPVYDEAGTLVQFNGLSEVRDLLQQGVGVGLSFPVWQESGGTLAAHGPYTIVAYETDKPETSLESTRKT